MIRRIDLTNSDDIKNAFMLVRQLRKHLDFEAYHRLIQQMTLEGYELWSFEENSKLIAVMGLRPYTDFVRGTHLYIDDLVVDENFRSKNIGSKLLAYAEQLAKDRSLKSLRLACALENVGGMKFYDKGAWTKRSYNYVKSA